MSSGTRSRTSSEQDDPSNSIVSTFAVTELQNQLDALEAKFNVLSNAHDSKKSSSDQAFLTQQSLVNELISFKSLINSSMDKLQITLDKFLSSSITHNMNPDRLPSSNKANSTNDVHATVQPGGASIQSNDCGLCSDKSCLHQATASLKPRVQNTEIQDSRSKATNDINSVLNVSDVQGRLLKIQMNSLKSLLSPDVAKPMKKSVLEDLYNNKVIAIEEKERELSKSLQYYVRSPTFNECLSEMVLDAIDDASRYVAKIRALYHQEGYLFKSHSDKLFEDLPKFSCQSDVNIFEFFRRFEALSKDYEISSEKAELLYEKYLSLSIQEEIISLKGDYNAMRNVLIKKYGDLRVIANNYLKPLLKECVPGNYQDESEKVKYFRKLHCATQKIDKSLFSSDIPTHEAEEYLYSNEFISQIMHFLPQEAQIEYVRQIRDIDNIIQIKGKVAYNTLISTITDYYELYDACMLNKSRLMNPTVILPSKVKVMKQDKTNLADMDSRSLNNSVHLVHNDQKDPKSFKATSSYRFPCIIAGHDHSLDQCEEFFKISPKERIQSKRKYKFRFCTLCLQSSERCQWSKCSNVKTLPDAIKCKDCKALSKKKNRPWFSVFFCLTEKHFKPSYAEISNALRNYVPKFDSSVKIIKITLLSSDSSSQYNDQEALKAFNTHSGIQEEPRKNDVIKESSDDCISLMQVLNIHGNHVLTCFDSGSCKNLVDKTLAEDLQFKLNSDKPTQISVISGNQIQTDGQINLALGPTRAGTFHELKAQCISSITKIIPKHDLGIINQEARKFTDIPNGTILPAYIGGDRIKLLIGLTHVNLQPVLIYTLPSGVGVYRSPFKDVFGSNICYGGPYRGFAQAN